MHPSSQPTSATSGYTTGTSQPTDVFDLNTSLKPSYVPSVAEVTKYMPPTSQRSQSQSPFFSTVRLTPCNTCFVSSVRSNYSPNAPATSSFYSSAIAGDAQECHGRKMGAMGANMKSSGRDVEPPVRSSFELIPILHYGLVPFIPAALLQILNDDYQTVKAQFNVAAATLPPDIAKDSTEYLAVSSVYEDAMQKLFVLLLSKRLALYFLATLATLYAGWRASLTVNAVQNCSIGAGESLDRLNREILEGETFSTSPSDKTDEETDQDEQTFATLVDQNPELSSNVGNGLALALPLILGFTLAVSYFAVQASSTIVASTASP